MLEVDVCLKTSLNNLSILCECVCVREYARMRDQKVIKRKDGVNVCVYVSCFPLFSLGIFCVSGCESKKLYCFGGNNKSIYKCWKQPITIMFTFNWNEFKELEKRNCKLNKP